MLPWAHRRATAAVTGTALLTLAGVVLAAWPYAAQQVQTPPVFRLGANYVRVDVYPTRDGQPVSDLQRADVELLEDGVPQKIEQFERIAIQNTLDRALRRDPNTVGEAREQAADPRRRVFVIYLDTGMSTIEASHAARRPLVDMLDRLIGDDDLYAVMTPEMSASAIAFARRTESIEAELARHWTWGQRDALVRRDPEEALLETCFPDPAPEKYCTGPKGERIVQPRDAYRGVAAQLIERRSEQRALGALDELVSYLGSVREERKAVIVVSQGWRLLEPKPALTRLQECDQAPLPGVPGVSPGGRLVPDARVTQSANDFSHARCYALATEYAFADNATLFRQLVERANRFNVSFYPFDTRGAAVFDRSIGARDDRIRNDPGEAPENRRAVRGPIGREMDRTTSRVGSLQTLAEATDGLAVVNTNDLAGGARRIANDLSTYYLIGYQSTNANLDGKWRAITVRVKTPGVRVRARKGYRALTEAELALLRGGGRPAADAATGTAQAPADVAAVSGAAALSRLVGSLAGLDRPLPWRSRAAWTPAGSAGTRIWIASELAEATMRQPEWRGGGTLAATLALADGTRLADSTVKIAPGARAVETRLDATIPASAEVLVRLRLSPAQGGLPLSDTLRVTPAGTGARLQRRGPTTGRAFVAAGEPRFRRSEHVRVAAPVDDAAAAVAATLLDRTGTALAVPVAARVDTIDGEAFAIGEASLAALAPGDYVLRLVVGRGDAASTSLTAIRVVN